MMVFRRPFLVLIALGCVAAIIAPLALASDKDTGSVENSADRSGEFINASTMHGAPPGRMGGDGNVTHSRSGNITHSGFGNMTRSDSGNITHCGSGNITHSGFGNMTEHQGPPGGMRGTGTMTTTAFGNSTMMQSHPKKPLFGNTTGPPPDRTDNS